MSHPRSPRNSSDGHINSRCKNEFQELNPLGKGGYGKVLSCRSTLDRKEYAMKVVPFASCEEERTLWEVRTLAQMCHPNIVLYHQAWIEGVAGDSVSSDSSATNASSVAPFDKTLYIAMEVCDETLKDRLKSPLEPDETWMIFRQICLGLQHIHQKKIIHRDLSTRNIFFDKQGVAKIGDFGLARFANKEGKVELTKNSGQRPPQYYAPETCEDNPYAVFSSDVFSLGVIFFELFHYMESESEAIRVISNLRSSKTLPQNWILPRHKHTLLRMIADDPRDRPSLASLIVLLELGKLGKKSSRDEFGFEISNKKRKYWDLYSTF